VEVVKAILRAAEEIDWGSEYLLNGNDGNAGDLNTNVVRDGDIDGPRKTGGSWRLLMDQNNHAKWSPLHLAFVQGGVTFGKVALARALLQMDDETDDEEESHRRELLQLVDRQKRTILHHNSETRIPTDDNFDAARFILSTCPSLVFSKDDRGRTPLEYVLSRLTSDPSSKSLRLLVGRGRDEEEADKRIYRMLKLLVGGMEREEGRCILAKQRDELEDDVDEDETSDIPVTDKAVSDEAVDVANRIADGKALSESSKVTETMSVEAERAATDTDMAQEISPNESCLAVAMRELVANQNEDTTINNQTINHDNTTRRNTLHSACHLSKSACPPDGSLILFLASEKASHLEYGKDSGMKLAEEKDELGNHALNIFVSNDSYASEDADAHDASRSSRANESVEYRIAKALLASHPSSISTPNNENNLPLKLAIQSGLRNVIALLVLEYPEAVLMDPSLENVKIFTEVLVSLFSSVQNGSNCNDEEGTVDGDMAEESKLLSTMFYLIRSRPDVVALGGASSLAASSPQGKADRSPTLFRRVMKKLWKK
jgi:hypothetical protein